MSPVKPTLRNWIFLISLGVIWGAGFMFMKIALGDFGPMTVTALRLLVAACLLVSVSFYLGTGLPSFKTHDGRVLWAFCIALGLFINAIPFTLLNWAQLRVSSGFAGLSMASVPLIMLPLAHVFVAGERLTLIRAIGFLIGFAGVLVLIGPTSLLQNSDDRMEPLARLACLGAAGCYAVGTIVMRLAPANSLVAFSAGGLLVGAILMVPTALYFEGAPIIQFSNSLLAAIYLGAMPTAVATLMMVNVIKSAGPSFMSLVNYQVPLWAVIFGVAVLGEELPASFIGALALILSGLAISQLRRTKAVAGD